MSLHVDTRGATAATSGRDPITVPRNRNSPWHRNSFSQLGRYKRKLKSPIAERMICESSRFQSVQEGAESACKLARIDLPVPGEKEADLRCEEC